MTLTNLEKTPWPWFGGKSDAAPAVWRALGDVGHYVEPFAGSLAVLLRRPHQANRTYYSETVNDIDGLLCNAWRSMQQSPDAMAEAASWPVCEADLTARHLALVNWRAERNLERLMADPDWHDPKMAGWWAWGQSSWIGSGWCDGDGPWKVGADGRIFKRPQNRRQQPGVAKVLPYMADEGRGVNRPQAREPGVTRRMPHVSDDGQGVYRPQAREPGVANQLPHMGDDGRGVNRPQAREPGVANQRPHLGNNGQGVNRPQAREPGVGDHPMTMPELRRWFQFLSARLRHVRILNGDWRRALTPAVAKTLSIRTGNERAGIFLDPPYSDKADRAGVYAADDFAVAHAVRAWCLEHGDDKKLRIVLAGYDVEHSSLQKRGWFCVPWYRSGFLKGGMGNTGSGGQQHRERLWLSPHCFKLV